MFMPVSRPTLPAAPAHGLAGQAALALRSGILAMVGRPAGARPETARRPEREATFATAWTATILSYDNVR